MPIRDRVKELRRVRAGELVRNGKNWRIHGETQRAALKAILDEVGFAGALLAREREDGRLELIDGQLRTETLPDEELPVLILDVTEDEAAKLLATYDPIGALAGADAAKLDELLSATRIEDSALQAMLNTLSAAPLPIVEPVMAPAASPEPPSGIRPVGPSPPRDDSALVYAVVIECDSEEEQAELLARFGGEGLRCRPLP